MQEHQHEGYFYHEENGYIIITSPDGREWTCDSSEVFKEIEEDKQENK